MSSSVSLQQADLQTAFCILHAASSLKVVRQTYLSSSDAARSPIAVFDLEMSR